MRTTTRTRHPSRCLPPRRQPRRVARGSERVRTAMQTRARPSPAFSTTSSSRTSLLLLSLLSFYYPYICALHSYRAQRVCRVLLRTVAYRSSSRTTRTGSMFLSSSKLKLITFPGFVALDSTSTRVSTSSSFLALGIFLIAISRRVACDRSTAVSAYRRRTGGSPRSAFAPPAFHPACCSSRLFTSIVTPVYSLPLFVSTTYTNHPVRLFTPDVPTAAAETVSVAAARAIDITARVWSVLLFGSFQKETSERPKKKRTTTFCLRSAPPTSTTLTSPAPYVPSQRPIRRRARGRDVSRHR
jgi:hypothetical protein